MWNLDSIRLRNMFSHEDTYYKFRKNKSIIIQGINRDDRNRSNGSGKSGLIEGAAIAFTGSPLRDIRNVDIVMNGMKFGSVEMMMSNDVLKKEVLITRMIYAGSKPQEVQMIINGEPKKDFTSVNEFNKYIFDELIGFSKEDFLNYYLIAKDHYQSFFRSGDVAKKQIISRFSKADLVDSTFDLIDSDIEIHETVLRGMEATKITIEAKINVLKEDLDDEDNSDELKEGWLKQIQENDAKIVVVQNSITEYKKQIKEVQKQREVIKKAPKVDYSVQINEIKGKIGKNDDTLKDLRSSIDTNVKIRKEVLSDCQKKINEIDDTIASEREGLNHVIKLISDLNKQIQGAVECPKCEHEFSIADKSVDIEECRKDLKEATDLEVDIKQSITEMIEDGKKAVFSRDQVNDDYDKKEVKIRLNMDKILRENLTFETEKREINKKIEENDQAVKKLERQIISITDMIDEDNKKIKIYQDNIDRYNKELLVDRSLEQKKKQEERIERVSKLENDLNELNNKILVETNKKTSCEEWLFNFQKFKSFLANKSINSINGFCNMYLAKMKSPLQIQIEGYKVLANKTIKETITTHVLRNGVVEGLYGKFSGGERITLDFSLIITLQKLINLNTKGGGLNFLGTDEIIESIDSVGLEDIINALNHLNVTSINVTHAPFQSEYENKLLIEKSGGISKIIEKVLVG